MDLTLNRSEFRPDGIFGSISDQHGKIVCSTLEHAYTKGDGVWYPKIPKGEFRCMLGQHRLASMTHAFETYEIIGVPGHTNLLFHWGNFNNDSEGCILVGELVAHRTIGSDMITQSKKAFADFIALQSGTLSFLLTVVND